jgi:hypothetical protein
MRVRRRDGGSPPSGATTKVSTLRTSLTGQPAGDARTRSRLGGRPVDGQRRSEEPRYEPSGVQPRSRRVDPHGLERRHPKEQLGVRPQGSCRAHPGWSKGSATAGVRVGKPESAGNRAMTADHRHGAEPGETSPGRNGASRGGPHEPLAGRRRSVRRVCEHDDLETLATRFPGTKARRPQQVEINGKKARTAVTRSGCRRGEFFEGCEGRREERTPSLEQSRVGNPRNAANIRPAAGRNKPATPQAEQAVKAVRNCVGGT